MLWASVGNTAPATFWAMYYLVSHPDALQVVRQELHDVLTLSGVDFSSDRDVTLSREQLEKLLYLGTCSFSLTLCAAVSSLTNTELYSMFSVDAGLYLFQACVSNSLNPQMLLTLTRPLWVNDTAHSGNHRSPLPPQRAPSTRACVCPPPP